MAKSRIQTISKNELQNILDTSYSQLEVLQKLGFERVSSNRLTLQDRIKKDGLCVKKWNENRELKKKRNLEKLKRSKVLPLKEILVENSTYASSVNLKNRLINEGLLKNECVECGCRNMWNKKPISLQLDHIDGNHKDNRLENLRILCPNCHSQTETWGGKKKKKM